MTNHLTSLNHQLSLFMMRLFSFLKRKSNHVLSLLILNFFFFQSSSFSICFVRLLPCRFCSKTSSSSSHAGLSRQIVCLFDLLHQNEKDHHSRFREGNGYLVTKYCEDGSKQFAKIEICCFETKRIIIDKKFYGSKYIFGDRW